MKGTPRLYSALLGTAVAVGLLTIGLAEVSKGGDGTFMPHATCYMWNKPLIALHVTSDLLIGLSYFAISSTLAFLVASARRHIPFHSMVLAFGLFIIACGSTHFMEVWTVWSPHYWLAGVVKLVTAVASLTTAILLPPLVPRILALLDAARTSTEREEQLVVANDELSSLYEKIKQLDHLKTAFFANASHELRTPLTLILGPVDRMMSTQQVGSRDRHELEVVRRNALILRKHVNDLLDVSKLEAGKMQMDYSSVDLSRLVRIMAANFESAIQERRIEFSVETPDRLIAQVDADKVQRILLNLLSNAFKFVGPEGRIHCALASTAERACLCVEDSGPGVPLAARAAIFERFNQGDGTVSRTGGTGLGLSIVKEFAELHEGSVTVEDAPGGGAAFKVHLPLRAPSQYKVSSEPPNAQALGGYSQSSDDLKSIVDGAKELARRDGVSREEQSTNPADGADDKPLVLIIEDNPDMNRFITESIGEMFRTASAMDGAEGLEKAISLLPDLIVTDVMMPRMGGEELFDRLQARPELKPIPVILLTAKADEELKMDLLRKGAEDYITKPFSIEELRLRVRNQVASKRVRDMLQRELASQTEDIGELAVAMTARSHDLQKAKEAAESSNRAKDQFLAVLSHELRTPLSPVLTSIESLKATVPLPAEVSRVLTMIQRNVELEARLIDDLLDVTRISKGKLSLNMERVNVHALLRHTIEICQPDAVSKQQQMVLDLSAQRSETDADSSRLLQIFWNLLRNSIKFTPPGGRLEIRSSDQENGFLRIEFEDSGMGIDAAVLPKIFNLFEQGDETTVREFGGLGVGLAVVKALAAAHGGTINARSPGAGKGATFTLDLANCRAPSAEQVIMENQPTGVEHCANLKVLLAEDHDDTRHALTGLLKSWGFEVEAVSSVGAALEKAGQKDFDLLISDLGLPDASGVDLMRELRRSSSIHGIAISGFGMEKDIARSLEAGFAEHLTKPVAVQKLKAALSAFVSSKRNRLERELRT